MGFAGGDTNLRRYVGNSPTNYIDPSGLTPHPLSVAPPGAISSDQWPALITPVIQGEDPALLNADTPFYSYFEAAAIRLNGGTKYYRPRTGPGRYDSPWRELSPGGRSKVLPDSVGTICRVNTPGVGKPRPTAQVWDHSFFIDAKHGKSPINLSSYKYEAIGYADVLRRCPASNPYPKYSDVNPFMLYITTSDTVISQEVVDLFTRNGVFVGQAWITYTPGSNMLQLSSPVILNGSSLPGRSLPPELVLEVPQILTFPLIDPFNR